MIKKLAPGLLALVGYALAALVFTRPLASHLSTHVLGTLSSDTGLYMWNLWSFSHELSAGRDPFFTTAILCLSPPTDLALHNYTAAAGLIALPLLRWLEVTPVYNLLLLGALVLNGLFGFLLVRRYAQRDDVAWVGGLLFAFSPFVMARTSGHLSLVQVAPLAAYWLAIDSLRTTGRTRAGVAAGASLAWALYSDPYYLVYAVVLTAVFFVPVRLRLSESGMAPRAARACGVAALAAAMVALAVWATGGWAFDLGTTRVSVRGLYNPMIAATGCVAASWALATRTRLALAWPGSVWRAIRPVAALVTTAALLLGPWLAALAARLSDGGELGRPLVWRNGVPGADLLALLAPNPKHPWLRGVIRPWMEQMPGGLIENVVSVPMVALAVLLVARRWAGVRLPRRWVVLTAGAAVLSLGPFLVIGGANTHIPLPWFALSHLPLLGSASAPTRFAALMFLGLAPLLGLALAGLARQAGRRGPWLVAGVGLAVAFELLPAPRVLHAAAVPSVYDVIAADERPVSVLHLPYGFRDGTRTIGYYDNARQYYQTSHGKPLIGGYLSRLTRNEVSRQRRSRVLRTLMLLAEGVPYTPPPTGVVKARGAVFARRAQLGYVVVERARTPPALQAYANEAFDLEWLAGDDRFDVYRSRVPLGERPPRGQLPPIGHARGVTMAARHVDGGVGFPALR